MNDDDWDINEIVASYGNRYDEGELDQFVQEINLIDNYLERIKRPKHYVFIETSGSEKGRGTGVESFTSLNQILQKLKKKGVSAIEIEKTKLVGFQIIHNPDSTFQDMRHYDSVMSNSIARDEFKKNSVTFENFHTITKDDEKNAFRNDYVKKEYDNLDLAYQTVLNYRKDPKKIALSALKMLENIKSSKIPRNDEFKKILDDLEKQILRLRSK